jgi:hypothetical protein
VDTSTPPLTEEDPPAAVLEEEKAWDVFVDGSGQLALVAALDPSSSDYGMVQVTAPSLGLLWPLHRASVARTADATTVSYDGRGFVNRRVQVGDLPLAGFQGPVHHVHLRIVARLDPVRRTGVVDLWVRHRHTHLVFTPPATGAEPVVRAVISALSTDDFAALYDVAAQGFRDGMSRAEFAAKLEALQGNDTIEAVRRTGPVSYSTTVTGIRYATAPASATFTHNGVRRHEPMQIVLVREDGQWRFATTREPHGQ